MYLPQLIRLDSNKNNYQTLHARVIELVVSVCVINKPTFVPTNGFLHLGLNSNHYCLSLIGKKHLPNVIPSPKTKASCNENKVFVFKDITQHFCE